MKANMEAITSVLPEGWEEKAKELKAFTRKGDYLENAEDLLRVLLLWADMGTFGHTAAFLRTTGDFAMSKVAIFERVRKSEAWLEWLAVNMSWQCNCLTEKPAWLHDYRVLVADATKVCRPGSHQADDVLHMLMELFSLTLAQQHLTDSSVGESMTNFTAFQKNDLVLGDRIYGTITSMRWLEGYEAYYVFRIRGNAFCLYSANADGTYEKFDLSRELEAWEEGKILSFSLYYKQGKAYFPVRVCAKAKTAQAVKDGEAKIRKSNHGYTQVTHLQKIYNQFIVVVTNLPDCITAEQVLELYRMRWQIELLFKRLKSILKYDEVQAKSDKTARAWFHCKLLVAAICEVYIQRAAVFSPSGENERESFLALLMVGIKSCLRRAEFSLA